MQLGLIEERYYYMLIMQLGLIEDSYYRKFIMQLGPIEDSSYRNYHATRPNRRQILSQV